MSALEWGIAAVERGYVPDRVTRLAIRRLCQSRLHEATGNPRSKSVATGEELIATLRASPIALSTDASKSQHYELPAEFFGAWLGPQRKYSCCFWEHQTSTLAEAEEAALTATCLRAGLENGQDILELGCGWGSLSLWMAQRFPDSRIVAMSHAKSQREFIEAQARVCGMRNLQVLTADINDFSPPVKVTRDGRFDRIVSVEMFEHVRNYELLLSRIASWLRPEGKLFVHIFCHRQTTYPFVDRGATDWMARHFFTGGMMPGAGLLPAFSQHLRVTRQWTWDGTHYERTARAWLNNLDARHNEVWPVLHMVYAAEARRWLNRWRVFLLAVAELFGYAHGREWLVSHYLLEHAGSLPRQIENSCPGLP